MSSHAAADEPGEPVVDRPVRRYTARGAPRPVADRVVVEEPLEIRLGSRPLAVLMRTPGDDLDLVAGFLLTEGLIPAPRALRRLAHCEPASGQAADGVNSVTVALAAGIEVPEERWKRAVTANAACGLCGKVAIADVIVRAPPVEDPVTVTRAVLARLPTRLRAAQPVFAQTGGLHAAGLFDARGRLLLLREDVGRHNAVDKIVGHFVRAGGLPPAGSILAVTGRAGFEILQKALVARIPVVAAVGAPSSLAVDLARDGGLTLVAFLRATGFNVYANPQRIRA